MMNPKVEDLVAMIDATNEIDPGDDIIVSRVEYKTADGETVAFWWDDDSEAWRLWDDGNDS